MIQQLKKLTIAFIQFFIQITKYNQDQHRVITDVQKLIGNNFDEREAAILLNAFVKKGRLIVGGAFESKEKKDQVHNDMLQ